MQLSARILTALAVLAFTVAVVAGKGATQEVSAATGMINAMNVGACTTTDPDVLGISDCKIAADAEINGTDEAIDNTNAFFEAGELGEAIKVKPDELYATYAHDPKTAAESPRAIIAHGDLIKISIKDTGRDRRDPVLIAVRAEDTILSQVANLTGTAPPVFTDTGDDTGEKLVDEYEYTVADGPDEGTEPDPGPGLGGSLKVVADSVGVKAEELADVTLESTDFGIGATQVANFTASGSYTIVFQRDTGVEDDFKPIAPNGRVRFFGRIDDGIAGTEDGDGIDGYGPFKDIGSNVKLDEDVISGENGTPAMVLNVNVGSATDADVDLQVIYYETSDVENLVGGQKYSYPAVNADGEPILDDEENPTSAMRNTPMDVVFTSEEKKGDALEVKAMADGNVTSANLSLMETGRFSGTYEGFLRLTDADGNGGGDVNGSWGEVTGDAKEEMGHTVAGAAVLGVINGPVVIRYKDSGGQSRSHTIQIDIDPPVINIDSPSHNSRSDDEKPSFIGTFNDGDAGLAADTFELYVDNNPTVDGGDFTGLDIPAEDVTGGDGGIDRRLEYRGYPTDGTTAKYGVVEPGTWRAADDATGRGMTQHRSVEADAYSNGATDGEFADEIEIDFDEGISDFEAFNHAIEFQALVRDLAGNVGFSDSDPAKPRFINNLGEKSADRGTSPNVLGMFSNHVVWLDEVDPYIIQGKTVTGFYGLDDGNPIRDRSSVMIVFDNHVAGSLIDSGTFTLEDGDGNGIAIADVMVKDELVFLKVDGELASDARPTLSITDGREVEDMAGNILSSSEHIVESNGDRVTSFKVNDGILPVFTVTLSGGSGTGVGSESSAQLTNGAIDITIESDEDINGAPKVTVVCSNIGWTEGSGDDAKDKKLSDFVGNRTGYDADDVSAESGARCGGAGEPSAFVESSSLSRPGNEWVYAWRNPSSDESELPDGGLTVIVWGRDRNEFDYYKDKNGSRDSRENWGSEMSAFTLDTTFNSPLEASGGEVQPSAGSDVAEPRPFILLDFAGERTNVSVKKLTVDGTDVLGSLDNIGENRFLYYPEAFEYGKHTVEFDARDAADNKPSGGTKFTFNVTQRDPFVLDISAGWNAISFPANPVDTALDAVFTDEAIDRVVGWNPMNSNGAWSIASRVDGVWTTSMDFAPLTDVTVRYGYWVHSMGFIKQSVDLEGPINRETGGKPNPVGIQTVPGWNFIGVIDQDGDQTEDHFGESLRRKDTQAKDPAGDVVTADDYMPGFKRAYTWDAIANGYRVLEGGDALEIGSGIWVFFPDGTTLAP